MDPKFPWKHVKVFQNVEIHGQISCPTERNKRKSNCLSLKKKEDNIQEIDGRFDDSASGQYLSHQSRFAAHIGAGDQFETVVGRRSIRLTSEVNVVRDEFGADKELRVARVDPFHHPQIGLTSGHDFGPAGHLIRRPGEGGQSAQNVNDGQTSDCILPQLVVRVELGENPPARILQFTILKKNRIQSTAQIP